MPGPQETLIGTPGNIARHLATWRRVEMIFGQHKVNYTVTLEAGGWEVIKKYVEMGQLGQMVLTSPVTSTMQTSDDESGVLPPMPSMRPEGIDSTMLDCIWMLEKRNDVVIVNNMTLTEQQED